MDATMMSVPLSTRLVFEHGARLHSRSRVLTFDGARFHTATYAAVAARATRLAQALATLGLQPGECVGTFCWNHQAHLEAYLAIPAAGYVLHTLNVRLFSAQIAMVIAHADDRAILIDASLLPGLRDVLAAATGLQHLIVIRVRGQLT